MQSSLLFDLFAAGWVDDLLLWVIASAAALLALVAVVNALNMFIEAETG
jgi:hypothetical protein